MANIITSQISYSKLSSFNSCPEKFKWGYCYFYHPRSFSSIYGTFGSAVHYAIHEKFKDDLNREEIIAKWPETFNNQLKHDNINLDEKQYDNFLQQGYPLINTFYTFFKDHNLFSYKNAFSELSFKLEFKKFEFYISGKIDIILELSFKDFYLILDFKTSKNIDNYDKEQLIYYYLALHDYLKKNDLPIKPFRFGFFFLRHNKIIEIKITKDDVKDLLRKILKKRKEISNSDFKPKPGSHCNFCEYKKIYCSYYNKKLKEKIDFKKDLRAYQLCDIEYMIDKINILNANDMGLGKTIECIYLIKLLHEKQIIENALIVVPNSLKIQWTKEIKDCLGEDYKNLTLIESNKNRYNTYNHLNKLFTITNYELLNRDIDYYKRKWGVIVLDEASRIKNPKVSISKKIKTLDSSFKIALTGTPIENKLEELYSIYEFLNKDLLGSQFYFDSKYITRGFFNNIVGYKNLDQLRKKIDNSYIRHTIAEVINDLPKCIQSTRHIILKDEQLKLYNGIVNDVIEIIKNKKNKDEVIDVNTLAKVTYLREVCDSANLVDKKINESSKIIELNNIIDDIDIKNNKIIIFSQFAQMINLIEGNLNDNYKELKYGKITGEIDIKERNEIIERLNNDNLDIMLLTDCGAFGLNLQQANILINIDLPFNPAIIKQRIGRVYRIGQKNVTRVINLIVKDSIEERVLEIIDTKKNLFDSVFDNSNCKEIKIKKSNGITYKELNGLIS